LLVREIRANTLLTPSGLADYAVNPYAGCQHGCVYCYAQRLTIWARRSSLPWGTWVYPKRNAPEVLRRELRRRPPGTVMVGSVCDAYQPLESSYRLTRRCLELLAAAGFQLRVLTKSALVLRDLGLLRDARATVGITVTCVDADRQRRLEPAAAPTRVRVRVLELASAAGLDTYALVGPLVPVLCDDVGNIRQLLRQTAEAGARRILVDRLNLRPGVLHAMKFRVPEVGAVLRSRQAWQRYSHQLAATVLELAEQLNLGDLVRLLW